MIHRTSPLQSFLEGSTLQSLALSNSWKKAFFFTWLLSYQELSRRKLSSYLTLAGCQELASHPQSRDGCECYLRPLLSISLVIFFWWEGGWVAAFSMGCTGWFLGLQCVCITCCLKCLFLELECDSHPFVLSISFFFFLSIVDLLVQCIKTIVYFMWHVFHCPPLPFVSPFSRLLNKFGLMKPPADLV